MEPAESWWSQRQVGGAIGEWVKKKTGQQAHAETNPKPGKEDEYDHDYLDGFAIRYL